jgi:diaminopimelate epimerase
MTATTIGEALPDRFEQALTEHGEHMSEDGIRFTKYTSFGNTFLIVNEADTPLPDDQSRARFARWALNGDFGIGGTDNVLYLRPAGSTELSADGQAADIVFRIFEVDGSETLSCGNGLLSTAAYLHKVTGGDRWRVLTELPSGSPKLTEVGITATPGGSWVNVGWPRPVAQTLYDRVGPVPQDAIDELPPLIVPLPQHEPWAAGLPAQVELSGLLTFTGEPHMVLFEGTGFPAELSKTLWADPGAGTLIGQPDTPEMADSRALVHFLGSYVNQTYRSMFPLGVHLNFARLRDNGTIEYRTWERAIDCETLACGSGTAAIMHVGLSRGLFDGGELAFWPHRCRWYQPSAALAVQQTDSGFLVCGAPRLVCAGVAPHSSWQD